MSVSDDKLMVLFLVDTSGSMYGQNIAAVNAAVAECVEVIDKYGDKSKVTIGYASFDEEMSDVVFREGVETFSFAVIPNSDGFYKTTSFASMYKGLYDYIQHVQNPPRMIWILITDGKSIDEDECFAYIERIKSKEVFRKAVRYVGVVGSDPKGMKNEVLEIVDYKMNRVVRLDALSSVLSLNPFLSLNADEAALDDKINAVFGKQ